MAYWTTMEGRRAYTTVVDFAGCHSRPDPDTVEKFFTQKLQMDLEKVYSIQFHNVTNIVRVTWRHAELAAKFAAANNQKHSITIGEKEYLIPIYIDEGTIEIRVHDLPLTMPDETMEEFMEQYGTVLATKREKWRNFFPGVFNGVRVVRMKLKKPIPSYVTIANEPTLVTYQGQTRTCRHCDHPVHPKFRCSEVLKQIQNKATKTTPQDALTKPHINTVETKTTQPQQTTTSAKQNDQTILADITKRTTKQHKNRSPSPPKPADKTGSDDNDKLTLKRQLSNGSGDNETKTSDYTEAAMQVAAKSETKKKNKK